MLSQIKTELKAFRNDEIEIVPGFTFNQNDTIETIYHYYHSQYQTGDVDSEGFKKYFYNIVRNPCNVATKAIDFDTKDIKIKAAEGSSPLKAWFYERDLKFWMKDKNFGKVLNRIFYELPKFGSVVLKVIDRKPLFVDLRNFVVEQSADTLDEASYIDEIHEYTPAQLRQFGKNWNYVEAVITEFEKSDEPFIKIYEHYEPVKTGWERTIVANVGTDIIDNYTGDIIPYEGVVMNKAKLKKLPYREFHWEKIPGRWLGVGRVEPLFDPQLRMNEIVNQKAKASFWATLQLFQTRDSAIRRNLMTDVKNGQVLNVETEITKIGMEDRNLASSNQEETRWLANRDEVTFSYDVTRGERLPAGTPLGSAQLAAAMTSSYFDQIRENVAMDIKILLFEDILPDFEKDATQEHILLLAGEDLDELRELIIKAKQRRKRISLLKRGKLPTGQEWEIMKALVAKTSKEEKIKLPEGSYKNLKYKIDIIITGEQEDARTKSANLIAVMQMVSADPNIFQDPTKRKLIFKILEQAGISPIDIAPQETTPSVMESVRGGGGVSRPAMPMSPTPAPVETRL